MVTVTDIVAEVEFVVTVQVLAVDDDDVVVDDGPVDTE
jgi:hypothetical protein